MRETSGKDGDVSRNQHSFEKRRRELEKKKKQDEKRQKKLEKKREQSGESADTPPADAADQSR